MKIYGLIGENLSHSFSATYFQKKILKEKISDIEYLNFELGDIADFPKLELLRCDEDKEDIYKK